MPKNKKNKKAKIDKRKVIEKDHEVNIQSNSTNKIKEIYESIYLNIKNRFLSYDISLDTLKQNKYFDDTNILYNNHYKEIKTELIKNQPDYKLIKEVKFLDPNKFAIKEKYLPKNKRKITGIDITTKVNYIKDSVYLNTPTIIEYENRNFKIHGSNYVNQFECTWKCENYRKKIKQTNEIYCRATIKGKRNEKELNTFTFYLKKQHSIICINDYQKISNNNIQIVSCVNEKSINCNTNNNSDKKISRINKKELEEHMKLFIINNKNNQNSISLSKFIDYGNNYIKDIEINDYQPKPTYFKNLYYKLTEKIFPNNSEEIYNYSLKLSNGQDFCRSNITTTLITRENKKIEHKHILFFSDFDIRRLVACKHILLDGTFSYPKQYKQTIIIMYLDPIIMKMIPGIFAVVNNKSYEGYKCVFTDLLSKIKMYNKSDNTSLNFDTFTSDFENALYTSFYDVFKILRPNLKHIGCFYHYMHNIENKLRAIGYGEKKNKLIHDEIIKFFGSLPFKKDVNKKIKDYVLNYKKTYPLKEELFNYFFNQWIPFFEKNVLSLNNINIKIRTNNSLENFSKLLKKQFLKKGAQEPYIFLDVIMNEVVKHEAYINNINSKTFNNASKSILNGTSLKDIDNDKDFFQEINNIIFDIVNNNRNEDINESIESKDNNQIIEKTNLNKKCENVNKRKILDLNSENKKFFWLINNMHSCYYDSFYTIFIFSLFKYIKLEISSNITLASKINNIFYDNFKHILNFCDVLIQSVNSLVFNSW